MGELDRLGPPWTVVRCRSTAPEGCSAGSHSFAKSAENLDFIGIDSVCRRFYIAAQKLDTAFSAFPLTTSQRAIVSMREWPVRCVIKSILLIRLLAGGRRTRRIGRFS